jgi:hypothetical protein
MAVAPFDGGLGCLCQGRAHWRAARACRFEPDWKPYFLINDPACAVIGFLCAFFNAKRG